MKPSISIIVPVYNAEKHLHRCIDSILDQRFKEFEAVLVNDGSSDNSGKICDDYSLKDSRIKVIHKTNGGASSARNAGMEAAEGDYIGFVDADDWIETDMYSAMYSKALEHDVDLVLSDHRRVTADHSYVVTQPIREGFYDKEALINEYYHCLLMRKAIDYPPTISNWACLFRMKLLRDNNIWYDTQTKYNEDFLFGAKAAYHANSFYYLKNHFNYNFVLNLDSTTNVYSPDKWLINLHVYREAKAYFGAAADYDFSDQLRTVIIFFAFNAINEIAKSDYNFFQRYREIKAILNHHYLVEAFKAFSFPEVGYKFKIIIFWYKYKLALLITLKSYLK